MLLVVRTRVGAVLVVPGRTLGCWLAGFVLRVVLVVVRVRGLVVSTRVGWNRPRTTPVFPGVRWPGCGNRLAGC